MYPLHLLFRPTSMKKYLGKNLHMSEKSSTFAPDLKRTLIKNRRVLFIEVWSPGNSSYNNNGEGLRMKDRFR